MNAKLPFSPIRREGDFVFLSGQIGLRDGVLVSGSVKEQTAQAMENIISLLKMQNLSLENVVDVTAFLVNQNDYAPFNETYASFFKDPLPTRTTVTVKSLPLGAVVELKIIARAA